MMKKIRLLSSEHQNSTDTAFYVVYVLCDEKSNTLTSPELRVVVKPEVSLKCQT